ncbi:hypothetical protein CI707_16660 [Shigella sonnei]|uniref:Uncharacterized protein n=1 Tax=Escherichia coli TaxID=562 RepID=A0AAP8I170_ECOLX|nr:hypothetical protein [Escherichia coli]PBP04776.1 hypothetical protein CI707_16660 [Shigella sonnei]EFA3986882.1 hypothetical protein [Escherichia coli]EFC1621765.1 hypothetical protein [Escherichia coli]EFC9543712.1 hypothetical protein [Escherichia coli]
MYIYSSTTLDSLILINKNHTSIVVVNGFYCFTSTYAGVKFYQFTFFCTRLSLKNEHDFVL